MTESLISFRYRFPGKKAPSFALSSIAAGDMSLQFTANRSRFLLSCGVDPEQTAGFHQTHSKRVVEATEMPAEVLEGDGGICCDSSIALAITVADCLPIALYDSHSGAFGLVHSGWKGTGVAVNALNLMVERYGTVALHAEAVMGPGIGGCCYAVDRARAALFQEICSDCVTIRDASYYLDLALANKILLQQAGVESISIEGGCTACSEIYGSYRRQGPSEFTRMLAVIGYF